MIVIYYLYLFLKKKYHVCHFHLLKSSRNQIGDEEVYFRWIFSSDQQPQKDSLFCYSWPQKPENIHIYVFSIYIFN